MTRAEWVVLPSANGRKVRRSAIVDFWPASDGKRVSFYTTASVPGDPETACCTLAEFEALLFAPAPAAPDDYTRAAVRYAEAEMRVGRLGYSPAAIDERTAAAYEYERLYFERERRDAG